ncbi:(Fe-S)-binding protein [Thermoflavimicrobium dichotomicum]|uniref:Glycolate oxidase iron-sulfur subunit n=1 Tax=Thermoflavimicrobium dichotomicum TaxID=46223 RepID=A0A1I3SN08_9BACL|nr:(Fe-S)-binding protein [Thermoflavimicrobium dichotomicum]SFJ58971.1 glycolate oxidase iron-sulfur subunit [Thermoflavimicrobium dichotomicum]
MNDSQVERLRKNTYQETNQCIQCGYCLPACPTYVSMGKESASPRGRINLVKLAAEGKIDIREHLAEPIDLCLGCRACEVVCPVNVPYGHILEQAKEAITAAESQEDAPAMTKIKSFLLRHLFPYPSRMRFIGNLAWVYQKSGFSRFLKRTRFLERISPVLDQWEKTLPPLSPPKKRVQWGEVFPAKGETKAKVAFFTGCITDALLYRTNRLTIHLLTLVGCEVVIPAQQNCCGALFSHQGMTEEAKKLARANIEAFEKSGADYYVNNAGGCGAMLREYDQLFKDEPEWQERAKRFVQAVRDISELLVQFGPLPFQKEWKGIITYQDSCHLRNVQKVINEPRQLLQSVPGATYVELKSADQCCGSGGIYNLLHFQESMKILDVKMKDIEETQATTIVTTNPGCYLQMRLGVERMGAGDSIQTLHLVELLAKVCGVEE